MTHSINLKQMVAEKGLIQAMATHSPISAKVAQEAGFDAL